MLLGQSGLLIPVERVSAQAPAASVTIGSNDSPITDSSTLQITASNGLDGRALRYSWRRSPSVEDYGNPSTYAAVSNPPHNGQATYNLGNNGGWDAGYRYLLVVTDANDAGFEVTSDPVPVAPGKPNLIYPVNGEEIRVARPYLNVQQPATRDGPDLSHYEYDFQIASDPGFNNIVAEGGTNFVGLDIKQISRDHRIVY
jgi:hypothetical protein